MSAINLKNQIQRNKVCEKCITKTSCRYLNYAYRDQYKTVFSYLVQHQVRHKKVGLTCGRDLKEYLTPGKISDILSCV